MAGAKETPRQKLISLMYLVFITMLALNVSKEVLDGFLSSNISQKYASHRNVNSWTSCCFLVTFEEHLHS